MQGSAIDRGPHDVWEVLDSWAAALGWEAGRASSSCAKFCGGRVPIKLPGDATFPFLYFTDTLANFRLPCQLFFQCPSKLPLLHSPFETTLNVGGYTR